MSAFSKFMKLFSMAGGVQGITNPVTGRISYSAGGITLDGIAGNNNKSLVLVGDSFTAYSNLIVVPTSVVCSNGVVTATVNGHGAYTGSFISVVGAADQKANVHRTAITVTGPNSFTYPAQGLNDGPVANDGNSIQILMLYNQIDNGTSAHIQRRTNGAFRIVSNAGCPGRHSGEILNYWAQRVAAFSPDAIYWEGFYNDINRGLTADQTIANIKQAIILAGNTPFYISGPWPFGPGAAANTAAKLQTIADLNRKLAALCAAYKHVVYIDNYSAMVAPATGLIANANYLLSDGIHPSWLGRYLAVSNLISAMAGTYKARTFASSGIANVGVSAASQNIARYMPKDATTGGGTGSGVIASVPAIDGATGAAASGTAGAAAGFTVSGSNVTTCAAWIKTETDGFSYQAAQYSAFSNTSGQGRISLALTNSDLTPGGNVSISFMGSVTTQNAASNKTPAGQSITSITAQLVITVDGTTYTIQESKPASASASNTQAADVSLCGFVLDNVPIPAGASITLARLDLIANCAATTSAFQMEMGRVEVIKNS